MKQGRTITTLTAGIIVGTTLAGPAATATNWLTATPSTQKFFVGGKQVEMEAYTIDGSNYVRLRDVGERWGSVWSMTQPPTASELVMPLLVMEW